MRNRVIIFAILASSFQGPLLYAMERTDPNLPTVRAETLQELSDTRIRQHIMRERMEHYPNRCVCPYQTKNLAGRSCKGRHELIKTAPLPICYPREVSAQMISEWRQRHR